MKNLEDFTNIGHKLIKWLSSYFKNIEDYPVKSNLELGDIEKMLPETAPDQSESFENIFRDFENIVMPGITHWQHPGFHAYFPANNSYPSVLAELLTAGLGVQGMKWITSPAATELEKVIMKWLFTNFDCSAFFVRDSMDLIKTFSLVPSYLQTGQDEEIDYSNWSIQLGRRFKSLKLWFVIRSYGVEGLQEKLRYHIQLAQEFERLVNKNDDFILVKPRNLNIICFQFNPSNGGEVDALNRSLLDKINESGKIFLSHTIIDGRFVIRFVCGQTNVNEVHISKAWKIIVTEANALVK